MSNDADPKFLAEFYKNLKILSQDLYKKSVVASTNSAAAFGTPAVKAAESARNPKLAKFKSNSFGPKNAEMQAALASLALGPVDEDGTSNAATSAVAGNAAMTHPADYFTAESLHERMKIYAQQGGIPMDYLDRYAASRAAGNHDD